MREGWKCPVCGAGVSPDEKRCEHMETMLPLMAPETQTWPMMPGRRICAACRRGGVCGCVQPGDGPTCITGNSDRPSSLYVDLRNPTIRMTDG